MGIKCLAYGSHTIIVKVERNDLCESLGYLNPL